MLLSLTDCRILHDDMLQFRMHHAFDRPSVRGHVGEKASSIAGFEHYSIQFTTLRAYRNLWAVGPCVEDDVSEWY